jgi:hypothetical protein
VIQISPQSNNDDNDAVLFLEIQSQLWEQFATVYQFTKLFDKGKLIQIVALEKVDIGYVLWPPATASGVAAEDDNNSNNDDDHGNMDKWLCYNNTNYINRPVG